MLVFIDHVSTSVMYMLETWCAHNANLSVESVNLPKFINILSALNAAECTIYAEPDALYW